MKIKIPGLPGVYYNTDAESTAVTAAFTAAGRRAPKPQGYAVQLLPVLWSFDVDLREVPPDHPMQYLHPEGAHSIDGLARDERLAELGRELDFALRFAAAVNDEAESAITRLVGREESEEGIVIEIDDGRDPDEGTVDALEGESEFDSEPELEGESTPELADEARHSSEPGREPDEDPPRDRTEDESGTGDENSDGDEDDEFDTDPIR